MPQLWIQPRGKLEKKAACSLCCGDEIHTCCDRAFYFHSMLKIGAFPPVFPLMGSMVGAFYELFLWNLALSLYVVVLL